MYAVVIATTSLACRALLLDNLDSGRHYAAKAENISLYFIRLKYNFDTNIASVLEYDYFPKLTFVLTKSIRDSGRVLRVWKL